MSEVLIRPARIEDVEAIAAFSAAMARETEGRMLDRDRLRYGTRSLLETPAHGFFVVAEHQGANERSVVGQLMVTYEWSDWRNAVFWWIQSVYVDPAWRRKGIFRKMHATVMATAKADPKVCGVRLYVESENRLAQEVYRKVGLKPSSYEVYETDFVLGHQQSLADRPDEA
ncbi:MAG: N-acetyltransferase [Nitrospira sp.]|jgi:ribosomal protein S18 acetylase RimI-like enzyme|nr:N-acetyltransferase [Nitrospira sp.]